MFENVLFVTFVLKKMLIYCKDNFPKLIPDFINRFIAKFATKANIL